MTLILDLIDPKPLDILLNDRDLLRDLFTYLDYVRERSIKRMTRTNEIPRADLVRIAKLLNINPPEKDEWRYARPYWVDFIDSLALRLHLVSYDLKGEYRGQTSQEPSFIENFITVDETWLSKFLDLSPTDQEKNILDVLNRAKSSHSYDESYFNEFFNYGPLGYLDVFEAWGSGTGIMPTLKFPEIRLFLLNILKECPPGQWFSVQSLIAYLKANHPYFLIPQSFPKTDRWGHPIGRYDNFHEGKSFGSREKTVSPNDPDAFERVEGRYIERFLEYIPLVMRFVDLAYTPQEYSGLFPSHGMLKAFRINERFLRLFRNKESLPKVTVQPNFDVVIESDFYPARLIQKVAALGEQVSNPAGGHGVYVGIFQLKKTSVASALVQQPDLNVIDFLKNMTGRDLPQNVQIELDEWVGHADQFILYENFALLETVNLPVEVEKFIVEKISSTISLVHSPEKVFAILEKLEHIPLRMEHLPGEFALLEETTTSIFPKEADANNAPKPAKQVKISRMVTISYQFPDPESFAATQKILAELRCPFQSDPKAYIITIQQAEQARFDEALKKIAADFLIGVE
jgi:hypothetical protein